MPILNVTYPDNPACCWNTFARCNGQLCTWTVPAGTSVATFEVWGGGGAGASRICGSTSMCCNQGQAGAGGGYSKITIPVTPGNTYVLCAGNGGQSPTSDENGYYNGSNNAGCCNGCPGGTSYVTGTGIPGSFCATGGGLAEGNGVFTCQAWCGWVNCRQGTGYNGQVMSMGGVGVVYTGSTPQSAQDVHAMGGSGGGPGGGPGGVKVGNNTNFGARWYCGADTMGFQTGGFPGGGGVGGGFYSACGCCYPGSPGGAGLVRVTY